MKLRGALIVVVVGATVALAAWTFAVPRVRPHLFHGVVMQSPTAAPSIDLQATTGELVGLDDFAGQLVVVYFGYTHCPDVCPTTLAALAKALDRMGDGAADVQVVMVTVDPERDTLELLGDYLGYFDDSFIGLTGPREDIDRVATTYGVYFAASAGDAESGYTVDHTANLQIIDRDGYLRLVMAPGATADDIADDLEFLR